MNTKRLAGHANGCGTSDGAKRQGRNGRSDTQAKVQRVIKTRMKRLIGKSYEEN